MPKRKRTKRYEEDLDHLMHKIRKLTRKIGRCSESGSSHNDSAGEDLEFQETASPILRPDDWFPEYPDEVCTYNPIIPIHELNNHVENQHQPVEDLHDPTKKQQNSVEDQQKPIEDEQSTQSHAVDAVPSTSAATPVAGTLTTKPAVDSIVLGEALVDLDDDTLRILGEDPSSAIKYGKDIRPEIATRLVHVATEGIPKESRKDIMAKYLTPANCKSIDAPKLNAEIKAAITENFAKRDKGIETKQKEMASAISCLGEIISSQLTLKDKNNDLLQKLIDLSRMLCDIQYADSVTRRNFILFTLKKDLRDHLVNTKIGTYLFGENLTETIKTAKTVNKSGSDIKAAAPKQAPTQNRKLRSTVSRPLNRRGPAARRPPSGPPPPAPAPRSRAPAPRAQPPPPTAAPARFYRPSYAYQPQQRRY